MQFICWEIPDPSPQPFVFCLSFPVSGPVFRAPEKNPANPEVDKHDGHKIHTDRSFPSKVKTSLGSLRLSRRYAAVFFWSFFLCRRENAFRHNSSHNNGVLICYIQNKFLKKTRHLIWGGFLHAIFRCKKIYNRSNFWFWFWWSVKGLIFQFINPLFFFESPFFLSPISLPVYHRSNRAPFGIHSIFAKKVKKSKIAAIF